MEQEKLTDATLAEQASKVIDQLIRVKEEFIKDKDELAVSIRKDVVATELRVILKDNTDYNTLKEAIEVYINNILKIK